MSDDASKFGLPLSLRASGGTIQPYIEEGTGSPDGVLSRPRGSLFLRTTPAQLWQNTDGATAWTQIATGSTGAHFATDAFIYFGDADNYQIGYVSNIVPYLPGPPPVPPTPGWLISSTLVDDTPGPGFSSAVSVGTQATLAVGVGVTGKNSGYLAFSTGNTDAEAGNTGGDVNGIAFIGGSALGTINGSHGTSGNVQDWSFEVGDSDNGSSGSMKFILGDAATGMGSFEWRMGSPSVGTTDPGEFRFYGALGNGFVSTMQFDTASIIGSDVTIADSGKSTPALVKILTLTAGGQTLTQQICLGSSTASGYVVDVKVVKTGANGTGGNVTVLANGVPVCMIPLNGLNVNDAVVAGLGGFSFTPHAPLTNGQTITVTTDNVALKDYNCVVYLTYVQG